MRTLLHSTLNPAPWKASLSSLLVHASVLGVVLAWWQTPIESPVFSGQRNAAHLELAISVPRPEQKRQLPVSIELPQPREHAAADLPESASAQRVAPQLTSLRPQPPAPVSIPQLTETAFDTMPAAPQLGAVAPERQTSHTSETPAPSPTPPTPEPVRQAQIDQPQTIAAVRQLAGVDNRTPPDFSQNVPPQYPGESLRLRQQGTVLLELHVDSSGQVKRVELLRSSGHTLLDNAAVRAVRKWQGRPALQAGTAVSTVERLEIRFIL